MREHGAGKVDYLELELLVKRNEVLVASCLETHVCLLQECMGSQSHGGWMGRGLLFAEEEEVEREGDRNGDKGGKAMNMHSRMDCATWTRLRPVAPPCCG